MTPVRTSKISKAVGILLIPGTHQSLVYLALSIRHQKISGASPIEVGDHEGEWLQYSIAEFKCVFFCHALVSLFLIGSNAGEFRLTTGGIGAVLLQRPKLSEECSCAEQHSQNQHAHHFQHVRKSFV